MSPGKQSTIPKAIPIMPLDPILSTNVPEDDNLNFFAPFERKCQEIIPLLKSQFFELVQAAHETNFANDSLEIPLAFSAIVDCIAGYIASMVPKGQEGIAMKGLTQLANTTIRDVFAAASSDRPDDEAE
jgi:hypothetical protein